MNLFEHLIQNYFDEKFKADYEKLDLWTTRERRLCQIFFTNGNGMEWADGVLVDICKTQEKDITPREWIANLKGRHEGRRAPNNPYPLCEYARFCSIPDDVEDTFLAGAWEAYQIFSMTEFNWAWNSFLKRSSHFYGKPQLVVRKELFIQEFWKNKGYIDAIVHKNILPRFRKRLTAMGCCIYWGKKEHNKLAAIYGVPEKYPEPADKDEPAHDFIDPLRTPGNTMTKTKNNVNRP